MAALEPGQVFESLSFARNTRLCVIPKLILIEFVCHVRVANEIFVGKCNLLRKQLFQLFEGPACCVKYIIKAATTNAIKRTKTN